MYCSPINGLGTDSLSSHKGSPWKTSGFGEETHPTVKVTWYVMNVYRSVAVDL